VASKNMAITHYKDLIVWQKSIDLVDIVYKLCSKLPKSEQYGLCSQMQRSAVSIPSNIAEGQGRNHSAEFRHFLGIAFGSSAELETQLIIMKRQYQEIDITEATLLLCEVQKMLRVLMQKLATRN
jgi:four helix bundle protein